MFYCLLTKLKSYNLKIRFRGFFHAFLGRRSVGTKECLAHPLPDPGVESRHDHESHENDGKAQKLIEKPAPSGCAQILLGKIHGTKEFIKALGLPNEDKTDER
ncbi:MAG: hypothetical protein G01um101418_805 [Parcubacteria group bacterium Gr01-1014_18]|nr:MAG: hypothetical protein Greene041636_687 [Parcubacteria group bacterium Greene0416_36]TSC80107.1 MAG: hypothetical protein G01um101418_805 [Parcubacteria group bacterium Gr01-1014_18]TSC98603.1 MAG: hypothetical protein Greene101420_655 [Parcubacteria group bacterium Greene1014_20]TSD06430.1 MAG: hypothetical protein Greene07142_921 [Parcubacteria group bacterium Greene0714_2]